MGEKLMKITDVRTTYDPEHQGFLLHMNLVIPLKASATGRELEDEHDNLARLFREALREYTSSKKAYEKERR